MALQTNTTFDIFLDNRTISVPVNYTVFAIQGDHNSRVVTFKIARYFDNVDLSTKEIVVNYRNADNKTGSINMDNIRTTNQTLLFDWIVESSVTAYKGDIIIEIEFRSYDYDEHGVPIRKTYSLQTRALTLNVEGTFEIKNDASELDYLMEKMFVEENKDYTYHTDIIDQGFPSIITMSNRKITMSKEKVICVQDDNHSQILSFRMERYYDGVDLAGKTLAIKFKNANGESDRSVVCNRTVTENEIYFGWLLNNKVTIASGQVAFAVQVLGYLDNGDFYSISTLPSTFTVEAGFRVDSEITPPTASWIESWQVEADNILRMASESSADISQMLNEINLLIDNTKLQLEELSQTATEQLNTINEGVDFVQNYTYFYAKRYNRNGGVFENVDYLRQDGTVFMTSIFNWNVVLGTYDIRTEIKFDTLGNTTSTMEYPVVIDEDGYITEGITSMRQLEYHGLM